MATMPQPMMTIAILVLVVRASFSNESWMLMVMISLSFLFSLSLSSLSLTKQPVTIISLNPCILLMRWVTRIWDSLLTTRTLMNTAWNPRPLMQVTWPLTFIPTTTITTSIITNRPLVRNKSTNLSSTTSPSVIIEVRDFFLSLMTPMTMITSNSLSIPLLWFLWEPNSHPTMNSIRSPLFDHWCILANLMSLENLED